MTRPLHIGLIMTYGREWIGGVEYIKNIILALGSLPAEVRSAFEISLICGPSVEPVCYAEVLPYLKNVYHKDLNLLLDGATHGASLRGRFQSFAAACLRKTKDNPFDRFVGEANIDFVYPYMGRKDAPYGSAAWIYDFQHKYLSHLFSADEIHKRDRTFEHIAQQAPMVVFSSQAAASDFGKFFAGAVPNQRVLSFRVRPNPEWYEGDPVRVQQEYNLPDRFFLVSNQFWLHKNHLVLFSALSFLREREIYPVIICSGALYDYRQPDYPNTILQTVHRLGIAHQVYLLGLVPREDQIQLVRRSLGIIQPSLFEGWSTVVEEARCLGKPIILSDIAVHREQSPPDSAFFDPVSAESLGHVLGECWNTLVPGPLIDREGEARDRALGDVMTFGYRFLEIARGQ